VVEDPIRSSRRGGNQVTFMHTQISYRRDRQVQLKRRPASAAVPRNKETQFRSGKQEIATHVVFANDTRKRSGGYTVCDLRPGVTVIRSLVQTRRVIVEFVTSGRDVCSCFVVRRDFDRIDQTLCEA